MGVLTALRPDAALAGLLRDYSTEVIPRDPRSVEAAVELLAPGTEVFIAALPGEGPDRMVAAAARLRHAGLIPVPHVTARSLATLEEADRLLGRLAQEAGVDRVLALGGDRDRPAGRLHSSQQLIESGLFEKRGVRSIFIACYPEGHPSVSDQALDQARGAKLRIAADRGLDVTLVSQFCFTPGPIVALARRLRALGVQAPFRVGVAGPSDRGSLIRHGLMCGVGASLRALSRRQALARNLVAAETPEAVLADIAAARAADPSLPVAGVHLFTFGAVARTAEWAGRMGA